LPSPEPSLHVLPLLQEVEDSVKLLTEQTEEYAAYIGIDWGDRKHDVCLKTEARGEAEISVIEHSPAALDAWAEELRQRFAGRPIAVCLELQRGPIVSALLKHGHFVLYPVNPQSLARYRQAWSPSGAKDDPTDAELALDVLLKHRDRLRPLRQESAPMRSLCRLVEDRRRLVGDRVRLTNRLIGALKGYFPGVLEWFEDKGTMVFCDFVERWPTAAQARKARKATLEAFFTEHNVRGSARIDARVAAIKEAVPLTEDPGVVTPALLLVKSLIPQLKVVLAAIQAYDEEISETCNKLSDFKVFKSFPSAAAVYAPRLLAAFGEDKSRFRNASEVQRYCGVAPVTERSGKQNWVHWRFKSSTFLRQTFVEWAALTIPRSYWAGEFYRRQRERGAPHQTALRALAFKWARILFRCWQLGATYDESRYLKTLKLRHSPLISGEQSHAQSP
jgi:transposase